MRIGLVAPPWTQVPPVGYGGTEVVVDNLARGLQRRGHDVVLFTVGDSSCPVTRRHLYPSPRDPMNTSLDEAAHVLAAYDSLGDVDLIHDHTVLGPLLGPQSAHDTIPVLNTNHGRFTPDVRRIFREVAKHAAVVAISRDQASSAPEVPIAAVIHHGIDLETYVPGAGDGGYLLFMGRMSPDKGVDQALRAAHASGARLVIATKMRDAEEHAYFTRHVEHLLRKDDALLVEPPLATRVELLQGASALLNPITWPEPFGLVMAEALATGTPVLAFRAGSAPEIVDDAVTGFLCRDDAELGLAIARIPDLNRAACRASAQSRFSLERMVDDHLRLYRTILAGSPTRLEDHRASDRHRHTETTNGCDAATSRMDDLASTRRA